MSDFQPREGQFVSDVDPLLVIQSLQAQIGAASVEIAKRDALVARLKQQLQQQAQQIDTLSAEVTPRNGHIPEGVPSA